VRWGPGGQPMTERLRSRGDFDRVFAGGRAIPGPLLVLRLARQAGSGSRVGIAVGRRLGSAVLRNRLRRRWREIVRLGPAVAPGWDLVVVVRGGSVTATPAALRQAWGAALRRGGVAATEPGGAGGAHA